MRSLSPLFACCLLASTAACTLSDDDGADEDLGDIGDGKSDSFGIVDKQVSIGAGKTRHYSFTADASFRIALTQPSTDATARPTLKLSVKAPEGTSSDATDDAEPTLVLDRTDTGAGKFSLTITNTGTATAKLTINVRPIGGFNGLPDPNADAFPDAAWQPPAVDKWPATYVVFNNPGCGQACASADFTSQLPRSVMIKMLVAAIQNVKDGGVVRVSNFNISSSASAKPVVDALVYAMQTRHARVRIVMDAAQNIADSKTTWFASNGAEVRFLAGLTYTNSVGDATGIMHSKIVAVDDDVVFTGSNNFSSTGFIINEENSVVLRAPANASRIGSFICDIDTMFDIGVEAGKPQLAEADRRDKVLKLDACNGADVWFPPTGALATGSSITYDNVVKGISGAKKSIAIAPDMMAHPGLVSVLIARAKKAKAAGEPFSIKLVLDSSDEALGNPAFGDCLAVAGDKYGLDMQVRYWRGNPDVFQLMHHKFMVIDAEDPAGAAVYNGSANYSAKALKWSFENVTRYSANQYRTIVDAFAGRFGKMFAASVDKAGLAAKHVTAPACPLGVNSL